MENVYRYPQLIGNNNKNIPDLIKLLLSFLKKSLQHVGEWIQ